MFEDVENRRKLSIFVDVMLYVLKTDYFLCGYILDGLLQGDDVKVITHRRVNRKEYPHRFFKVRKFLAAYSNYPTPEEFFDAEYVESLRAIKTGDNVLCFGVENMKDLLILKRILPSVQFTVFLWNPMQTICRNLFSRRAQARELHANGFRVFTFDGGDAVKYGFDTTVQVYRYLPKMPIPQHGCDLFFVGKDKGRIDRLVAVKRLADKAGCSCDFRILKDKHTPTMPKELSNYGIDSTMSYEQTLQCSAGCRCVVELLQYGQHGSTVRMLEAMFLQRKLLTDNISVLNSDLYDPSRILLFDRNTTDEDLRRFMESEFKPIEASVLEKYEINNWVNNLMNN